MVVTNPLIPVTSIPPVLTRYRENGTRQFDCLMPGNLRPYTKQNAIRVVVIPNHPADSSYGPDGRIIPRVETGRLVNAIA